MRRHPHGRAYDAVSYETANHGERARHSHHCYPSILKLVYFLLLMRGNGWKSHISQCSLACHYA